MRICTLISGLLAGIAVGPWMSHAQTPPSGLPHTWWVEPGVGYRLEQDTAYENPLGRLGLLHAGGPVDTKGHPFFEPIGRNGRACVTCHQPANAMSISVETIRARWKVTGGKDPLFEAIDGSDNPSLPQEKESSHSLLLNRGLFRVGLPWPPKNVTPEFDIAIVRDPSGVNRDPKWGLNSANPTVSVFRRPRMSANLKYVLAPDNTLFNVKLGVLLDRDPETGKPVSMNMMADARAGTLKIQAIGAFHDHLEGVGALPEAQLKRIIEFESQIYAAQVWDRHAGNLVDTNAPRALGPVALLREPAGILNNPKSPVFLFFDEWQKPSAKDPQSDFRASVARGADIFLNRNFWVRNVAHINSIGLGNPAKRSCAVCHNAVMSGMDRAPGWVDLGTTNYPTWTEPGVGAEHSDLPVFRLTCKAGMKPHAFLGPVVYTSDPGRALITGKCADIGAITMGQFRGLAARAPYFTNGSAGNLAELVDYYDRRFDIRLSSQEKQDLVNFLGVL